MPKKHYTKDGMKENQYHIDVTPEEDMLFRDLPIEGGERGSSRFKIFSMPIVVGVVAVHLAGVAVIYGLTPKNESVHKELPQPQVQAPAPDPVKEPISPPAPVQPPPSQELPQTSPPQKGGEVKAVGPKLVTSYTVKKGDTFSSIVKKYKLSSKELIKINNLQDPNKLKVGQVLKFIK